jgi:hypothetical protein
MESTGIPNRVQISQETADFLAEAKKSHWFELRPDKVQAKGKGELTTFLLHRSLTNQRDTKKKIINASISSDSQSAASSYNEGNHYEDETRKEEKRDRIADWTVEVMTGLLQEIEVRRLASQIEDEPPEKLQHLEEVSTFTHGKNVIDEVQVIIELPEFDEATAQREAKLDPKDIQLPAKVLAELRVFVRTIATMYHANGKYPFCKFSTAFQSIF